MREKIILLVLILVFELAVDFGLFFMIPLGVEWNSDDKMFAEADSSELGFLGGIMGYAYRGTGVGVARYPMFSIVLHEKIHMLGYGEEIAYPVTVLTFITYTVAGFYAILKIGGDRL